LGPAEGGFDQLDRIQILVGKDTVPHDGWKNGLDVVRINCGG
jgi:hypothetical protein